MPIGPSRTAEMVCLARAAETRRPAARRVLDDPYARLFLRPMTAGLISGRRPPPNQAGAAGEMSTFVVCRHRAIDDWLLQALAAGAEQVAILGAGYDTRAWRFAAELAGRPVWEVDFPPTSQRKERLVTQHAAELPATSRRRVEVDFERESFADRLLAEGFPTGARTFFVWEGVSMYLRRATVEESVSAMRGLGGAGSELAADFFHLAESSDLGSLLRGLSPTLAALVGEPMRFVIHPEDVVPFLGRQRVEAREVLLADDLRARYLRDSRRPHPGFYVVRSTW